MHDDAGGHRRKFHFCHCFREDAASMPEKLFASVSDNRNFSDASFPQWRGKRRRNRNMSNLDLVRDLVYERVTIFLQQTLAVSNESLLDIWSK